MIKASNSNRTLSDVTEIHAKNTTAYAVQQYIKIEALICAFVSFIKARTMSNFKAIWMTSLHDAVYEVPLLIMTLNWSNVL